jgi:hypothetical protein
LINFNLKLILLCFVCRVIQLSKIQGALCGALIGAAHMVWVPETRYFELKGTEIYYPRTWMYVFGKMKKPTVLCSIVCGTYCGVECIVEQLRDDKHTKKYIQASAAGAATGLVIGSITKRPDVMLSLSAGMGLVHGLIELNGHTLTRKNYVAREGDIPGGPTMSIKRLNPTLYKAIQEFKNENPKQYAKFVSQEADFYTDQDSSILDTEINKVIDELIANDIDFKLYWPKIIQDNPDIAEILEANNRIYKWSELRPKKAF